MFIHFQIKRDQIYIIFHLQRSDSKRFISFNHHMRTFEKKLHFLSKRTNLSIWIESELNIKYQQMFFEKSLVSFLFFHELPMSLLKLVCCRFPEQIHIQIHLYVVNWRKRTVFHAVRQLLFLLLHVVVPLLLFYWRII